jgi:hypothetical protein
VTGAAVLTEALARGGKLVWNVPDKPRLLVPQSFHGAIKANQETVKEILRRAAIFRERARAFGVCPLLVLPDCPDGDGCLSCGAEIPTGHFYRCQVCALAVRLALEATP